MNVGKPHEDDEDALEQLGRRLDEYLQDLEEQSSGTPPTAPVGQRQDVGGDSPPNDPLMNVVKELFLLRQDSRANAQQISTSLDAEPDLSGVAPDGKFDKYTIVRVLGRGGQSYALQAFDPELQRHVVLKVYRDYRSTNQQEVAKREGRALVKIQSPYIAQCFDVNTWQEIPYLTMEFVRGSSLQDQRSFLQNDPLKIARLVATICHGLHEVHASGILHRDLKPANVVVDEEGRPKILDFGLSVDPGNSDRPVVAGTPAYMAPEQANGDVERIDTRTDVFGVGAILYDLLSGHALYEASSRSATLSLARRCEFVPLDKIAPKTPVGLQEICARCLHQVPSQRYQSARDLGDALDTFARQHAVNRKRGQLAVVAAVSLIVATVVWQSTRTSKPPQPAPTPQSVGEHDANEHQPSTSDVQATAGKTDASDVQPPEDRSSDPVPPQPLEHQAPFSAARNDFPLSVKLVGGYGQREGVEMLRENDPIQIEVGVPRDCYLVVWSVEPGQAVCLFPNAHQTQNLVKAGQHIIPGEAESGPSLRLRAHVSDRVEHIYVLASTERIDSLAEIPTQGDYHVLTGEDSLNDWKQRHRGITLEVVKPQDGKPLLSEKLMPYQVFPK